MWRPALLGALLTVSQLAAARGAAVASGGARAAAPGLPLDKAVVQFSKNEVLIAKEEAEHAHAYIGEAKTHLKEAAVTAELSDAKAAYDLARASVPLTRAAMTEAKISAVNAKKAANDVKAARDQMAAIPQKAADLAAAGIMQQVKAEAISHAEMTDKQVQANFAAEKDKRIATKVAGMVQPYHLAVMRAQKASAEYKHRADTAMHSAMKLADTAKALATKAQGYQSAGYTYEATQYMMMAHGTMNDVQKLIGYANKFQAQAQAAANTVPRWQFEEGTAAAFTTGTYSEDPPMPLPAAALLQSSAAGASSASSEALVEASMAFADPAAALPQASAAEVAKDATALLASVRELQSVTYPAFLAAGRAASPRRSLRRQRKGGA